MTAAWQTEIAHHMEYLAAAGMSPQTLRLRRHYLRRLAEAYPAGPWSLGLDELVTFVGAPSWAPETRKTARSSVRSFYRWATLTDRVRKDPSLLLPPVHIPPAKPKPAPDEVFVRALLRASPRDALMLRLAAYAGLRRAEIACAHRRDIIGERLRVRGKGGKLRVVPLHPKLISALEAAPPVGYLFPGRIEGHLSAHHVGKTMARLLGPGWTAHKLRHRFATRAYAVERDLRAVQELLGHSKPETTARYTAVPDDALRAAVLGAA